MREEDFEVSGQAPIVWEPEKPTGTRPSSSSRPGSRARRYEAEADSAQHAPAALATFMVSELEDGQPGPEGSQTLAAADAYSEFEEDSRSQTFGLNEEDGLGQASGPAAFETSFEAETSP